MPDPAVPVDHRPPLPPPNPLLGQTVDGNPARSLVDRTTLDLDAIKTRVAAATRGGEKPVPYTDPTFTPSMVVCKADRNRNDMRIWEAFQPEDAEPGEWLFDALWRTTTVRWDKREDLPGRLAVVDGCGFARSGAAGE